MRVVKTILSYEYLWIEIRVKGGAYECGGGFGRTGTVSFSSYRDPNLRATNDVFENTPKFLEDFEASEREMTKYVIGTISEMDTPLTASARGERSMSLYLSKVEDIKALAHPVRAALEQGNICVVGNEDKIQEAKDLFKNIVNLA